MEEDDETNQVNDPMEEDDGTNQMIQDLFSQLDEDGVLVFMMNLY
jgi:hypothetical protein